MSPKSTFFYVLFMSMTFHTSTEVAAANVVVGSLRVQCLSGRLLRIEQKGPEGFEDRETFLVTRRDWAPMKVDVQRDDTHTIITTPTYTVNVPADTDSIVGVEVYDEQGALLHRFDALRVEPKPFPEPHRLGAVYLVPDTPRVVPPEWGATPQPPGRRIEHERTSGWDLTNDAPDIYVFLNTDGDYDATRREFLRLTGPIPLPPLWVLGFWNSLYYPYTEKEALEVIDRYRREEIPLDVFVVDTNWREGGSRGYDISEEHFPDMGRFVREAHRRHARLVFNDHPEPQEDLSPLNQEELQFRWAGLTSLLDLGIDAWWYDKNWDRIITGPIDGIDREVWGQRVFTDMHARRRPDERPIIMSMRSEHLASHRFPIWWTGDIQASFHDLEQGVADSVSDGIRFLPWVNQDLGGHVGTPTTELYVRFVEWGTLSPVARLHGTWGETRYPWAFGEEAERIVRDYVQLRYRLLPTLYAAARRAYDDGTPILQRCDLVWPAYPEARSNLQYLLGDDILVAPILEPTGVREYVPTDFLQTPDGEPGLKAEYFANMDVEGSPKLVRTDAELNFDWAEEPPAEGLPPSLFSVRWTGKLGPVPETGAYQLFTDSDDGVRLWLDGELIIDHWSEHGLMRDARKVELQEGKRYDLRVEYFDIRGAAICRLGWLRPSKQDSTSTRNLWMPPGWWEDAWTGERHEGPRSMKVSSPLWHTPMYVRRGGLVLTLPQTFFTDEGPWENITVDAYPTVDADVTREIYEDDGSSLAYTEDGFCRTPVHMQVMGERRIELTIGARKGAFKGALARRAWTVRIHLEPGQEIARLTVNGEDVPLDRDEIAEPFPVRILRPGPVQPAGERLRMPFLGAGQAPGAQAGPVVELYLPPGNTLDEQRFVLTLP